MKWMRMRTNGDDKLQRSNRGCSHVTLNHGNCKKWSNWRECEIVRQEHDSASIYVLPSDSSQKIFDNHEKKVHFPSKLEPQRQSVGINRNNPISKFTPVPSLLPWFPAWHKENLPPAKLGTCCRNADFPSRWSSNQTEINEYQRQIHDMIINDWQRIPKTNRDSQDLHSYNTIVYILHHKITCCLWKKSDQPPYNTSIPFLPWTKHQYHQLHPRCHLPGRWSHLQEYPSALQRQMRLSGRGNMKISLVSFWCSSVFPDLPTPDDWGSWEFGDIVIQKIWRIHCCCWAFVWWKTARG